MTLPPIPATVGPVVTDQRPAPPPFKDAYMIRCFEWDHGIWIQKFFVGYTHQQQAHEHAQKYIRKGYVQVQIVTIPAGATQ